MNTPNGPPLAITSMNMQVLPDYRIEFSPEDYIVLVLGFKLNHPATRHGHPRMVAARPKIFEFKHYRDNGSKFWTSTGGIEFYFAVPKSRIMILPIQGLSYPEILVGNARLRLNVSGGSGNPGWVDWIGRVAHTCVNHPVKTLRAVAENALSIPECRDRGISLELEPNGQNEKALLEDAVASREIQDRLIPGMNLVLREDFDVTDLVLQEVHGRRLVGSTAGGSRFRISTNQISWAATAKKNNLIFNLLPEFNHLSHANEAKDPSTLLATAAGTACAH